MPDGSGPDTGVVCEADMTVDTEQEVWVESVKRKSQQGAANKRRVRGKQKAGRGRSQRGLYELASARTETRAAFMDFAIIACLRRRTCSVRVCRVI